MCAHTYLYIHTFHTQELTLCPTGFFLGHMEPFIPQGWVFFLFFFYLLNDLFSEQREES